MSEPMLQADAGADVRGYVTAVRGWLADLPREDVEDLTTGMEADLAERVADSGGLRLGDLLGEPEQYAAELRSAAGLPPRQVIADDVAPVLREPWTTRMRTQGDELLARFPWLRDLRPTWWLVRGAVLGWVAVLLLHPMSPLHITFPLVGAGLSFWWSRRGMRREGWRGRLPVVANTVALLALVPATVIGLSSATDTIQVVGDPQPYTVAGLAMDGTRLSNVYVYGSDGTRLTDVRLFGDQGQELGVDSVNIIRPWTDDGLPLQDDAVFSPFRFPLRFTADRDPWLGLDGSWQPPVAIEPLARVATPTPSPGTSQPPTPSAGGTSSATPEPTATPGPTATP